MKRSIIVLVLSLVTVAMFPVGVGLAVTRVEPIGVEVHIARLTEELLQTEFSKQPLFVLVERGRLDEVLQEQQLQLSGVVDATTAVQAGDILKVDKVLFGSIGLYASGYVKYVLSLRMVDVEKGAVEAAESIEVRTDEELTSAVAEIVRRLSSRVEVVGRIARTDDSGVYVSLGTESNLAAGSLLSVVRVDLIKDDAGRIILREEYPVANLSVETVSKEGSRCRVLEYVSTPELGMVVRKGTVELKRSETDAGLEIRSLPEGARVYLDNGFLGITPLSLASIQPGTYRVEIRSGAGYRPYAGKVTLRAGRTVTLERELEEELEVEDLLVLGRVPRRQTDPKEAMKKALIPGQGLTYNGYRSASVALIASMMPGLVSAVYGLPGFSSKLEEYDAAKAAVAGGTASYTDARNYSVYPAYIRNAIASIAYGGGISLFFYGSSLIEARITAREEFRYPVYIELYMAPGYTWAFQNQTTDTHTSDWDAAFLDQVVAGWTTSRFDFNSEISIDARRYYYAFGFVGGMINMASFFRFPIADWLSLGLGNMTIMDMSGGDADEDEAHIGSLTAPALLLSIRSLRFGIDLSATPYALYGGMVALKSQGGSANYEQLSMLGVMGSARLSWFFTRKTGLSLRTHVCFMSNPNEEAAADGFTITDKVRFVISSLGLVLRF